MFLVPASLPGSSWVRLPIVAKCCVPTCWGERSFVECHGYEMIIFIHPILVAKCCVLTCWGERSFVEYHGYEMIKFIDVDR